MFHQLSPVAFALSASISWGAGDFSGGLATRRAQVLSVVFGSYAIGFCMLVVLALLWSEPFPTTLDLISGGVAGLAGAVGLVAFYQALSVGHSGHLEVAAMLSSLYPAVTVLLATIILKERVSRFQAMGIVIALIAIPLISL